METNDRIAQWENMTEADPENSMGWLSLGTAYKDADRLEDAAESLRRAVQLDGSLSRAYQLLGQVLIKLGQNEEAGRVLTRGYQMAAQRGDVMPQRAMGSLLEKLGWPVPRVETRTTAPMDATDANSLLDRRTGRPGLRLPDPPMRGPLGRFIYDHFSQETWREWIGQGTKVINELKLDFSNLEHQRIYDMHMMDWLGITQEEVDAYAAEERPGQ